MQKLIVAAVFILFFAGCEKEFDTVIDTSNPQYQVSLVAPTDSILFNSSDSLIVIRLNFSEAYNFQQVFCNIIDPEQNNLNSSPIILFDDGSAANGDQTANDGKFSAKFPMSEYYANGYYDIKYYITDETSVNKQVALSRFKYNNGQANFAPVISDEIIDPDTIVATDTVIIQTSLKAIDQNGQNDIEKVYFIVYRPDGTTNGSQIEMYDDGNLVDNGDQTAGDGIYSRIISVNQNNIKGTYRFEFQAKDRGQKLSNIINHLVLIQ